MMEIQKVTITQAAGRAMNAGLYLRFKTRIQSLGWGWQKKKKIDFAEAEVERPWANLAEWLRLAHSLLDDKRVELTRSAD
jgi:hypothetical protein